VFQVRYATIMKISSSYSQVSWNHCRTESTSMSQHKSSFDDEAGMAKNTHPGLKYSTKIASCIPVAENTNYTCIFWFLLSVYFASRI